MSNGGSEKRYKASEALKEKYEQELDTLDNKISRLRVRVLHFGHFGFLLVLTVREKKLKMVWQSSQ